MYGIVLSALNATLGWIFRAIVVKFVIFTALALLMAELLPLLIDTLVPAALKSGDGGMGGYFAAIGNDIYYFVELFKVPEGIGIIIAAYIARFLTRRLPIIG